jgi:ankyrin repeat protein
LAWACVVVLLQLDEQVDKERVATFPLAWYAAEHWVDHTKFENVESQIEDALEHLFNPIKPHLRACIWMYDVEKKHSRFKGSRADRPPPLEATPLYYAASLGFSGLSKRLITTHAEDVNVKCYDNRTPLFVACRRGYVDVARLLLDHGADMNAQTVSEMMALHVASSNGHLEVAQLLLERGAALNTQTKRKDTPLCLASEFGHLEVVRLLLDHGADVHIRGEKDRTPYQVAVCHDHGHHDVAQLLLEHGAKGDMWIDEVASVSSMF